VGMRDGKRPQGRPRCRWVDHIKMDLREIGRDGINWIDLAQDRADSLNTVIAYLKLTD
jgi:hypothetical protein